MLCPKYKFHEPSNIAVLGEKNENLKKIIKKKTGGRKKNEKVKKMHRKCEMSCEFS